MPKSRWLAIILTVLIVTVSFTAVVFAGLPVGVKKGDWIKYQVTVTGNPPPDENITWARMDITGVQGETINVNVQTGYANGTIYPENGITLNIATGAIGDGFFVPTNLTPGDQYSTEYEGIINITSVGQLEAGGAERTVLSGVSNQTTYYWDKQAGIMVAATSNFPGYSIITKTSGTNIWQPQILGLDLTVFYALTTAIAVVIVTIIVMLVWRTKVHMKKLHQ
jgi:multidrug transporter EmrE-like cation transporter